MVRNSDFLKITFFLGNSMSSMQPSREKNRDENLDCGHPTYTINTLKFEYLGPCTPRSAYIFNSVVWR